MPLLSIVIPTYNRSKHLEETLKSITDQVYFINTNEVEIIISDNCSIDDTKIVAEKYVKKFPHKIIYSRNSTNILDRNYEKALSLATGVFLKLNNDTLRHLDNSLEKMILVIKNNIIEKPVLFFSNKSRKRGNIFITTNLSDFIKEVSFYSTWIGAFGIWRDSFEKNRHNFNNSLINRLKHLDVLYNLINKDNICIVDDRLLMFTIEDKAKGGYNFVNVFLIEYNILLERELILNNISKKVYDNELSKVLLKVLCKGIIYTKIGNYNFDITNSFEIINKFYKKRPLLLLHFYVRYLIYFILKKTTYFLWEKTI